MSEGLDAVLGHAGLKQRLRTLLATERLPGGLLIVGEEGRGKKALAVAFARELLARGDARAALSELEILEPETTKRLLGIDAVRRLKEEFSLTPVAGQRRVAVVAHADRLTVEAANALLKLLEEPPPGCHLVLTAASQEALLETITSRCLVLRAGPLSTSEVVALLESRGVPAERAALLAALVEGRGGLALELAHEGLDEKVLLPAALLLLARGPALEQAVAVTALLGSRAEDPHQLRSHVVVVLDLAAFILRAALRRELGASAREVPDLLEPALQVLADLPAVSLERRLTELVAARSDVWRNLSVDVILADLLAGWSRAAALT